MKRRALPLLAVVPLLLAGLWPADAGTPPVVTSDNVNLVTTLPELQGAISTAFATDKPFMYVNTLHGISVYDIADPKRPMIKGFLPLPHFENEAMSIGERADGTKFVIIGLDQYAVSPTDTANLAKTSKHLIVIDVTDPAAPVIKSRLGTTTSTHTVQCIGKECNYAYTSGAYDGGKFDVVDLTNLAAPKIASTPSGFVAGMPGGPAGIGNHQWDIDDSGLVWGTGGAGAAALDVTDPKNPTTVASTDAKGLASPYNDFTLHNSFRPGAKSFAQTRDELTGRLVSGSKETASPFDGNVLLATEEDYDNPVCGGNAGEGAFSTWYIPYIDRAQYLADNPKPHKIGKGKITPLDTWNSEILDSGRRTELGALCSAHYFTYHDSGFIAQGWYQQGTRILDVRNPRDIKQVGYYFAAASETWHAYWVPEYDATGKQTGKDSNIIYTNDVVRGIDVLEVTLPVTAPAATEALVAPILPEWLDGTAAATASAPRPGFGYACRIAGL